MKPFLHAKSSAKRYGGSPDDYLDIHDFMDSTKSAIADVRHRAFGTNDFMSRQKLKKQYTLTEILAATKGQYGHEQFKSVVVSK